MEVIEPRLHNISRFNLVFDHLEPESWILDLLFRFQDARFKIQDSGCKIHSIQVARCRMQDTGCRMQVAGRKAKHFRKDLLDGLDFVLLSRFPEETGKHQFACGKGTTSCE